MDSDRALPARYHAASFSPAIFAPWMRFAASPPLGRPGPDFPLWDRAGQETRLHPVCAQHHYTIVEFGSFTGPYGEMAAPSMNDLAARRPTQGVGSFFLTTHAAHPGEYNPHRTALEQRLRHAQAVRDVLGGTRPILWMPPSTRAWPVTGRKLGASCEMPADRAVPRGPKAGGFYAATGKKSRAQRIRMVRVDG